MFFYRYYIELIGKNSISINLLLNFFSFIVLSIVSLWPQSSPFLPKAKETHINDLNNKDQLLESKLSYVTTLNKNIFSNLSIGICILDYNLSILTSNRAFEKIFKREKRLLINRNFYSIFPDLKTTGLEKTMQLVLKSGRPFYLRSYKFTYNQSKRCFNLNLIPQESYLDDKRHLIFMLEDLNSQQKTWNKLHNAPQGHVNTAEYQKYTPQSLVANYASLLDNSQDIIFTIDRSINITYLNENFEKITGYCSKDFINLPFINFINEKDRPSFLSFYEDLKKGKYYDLDIDYINKDNELINCILIMRPIFSQQELIGCIGTIKDVTEKKQIQQKLVSSEKLASLGAFASSIAHEINNPIGIIVGFIDNLLKKDNNFYSNELNIIKGEALRCKEIMTSLLDFASRNIIHKSNIDIRQTINKCLDLLHYRIKQENISISKNLDIIDPIISIDTHQIQQAIINILLNAIESLSNNNENKEITISMCLSECIVGSKKTSMKISFSDNGYGICAQDINNVFDPFFTTKGPGHTGLGLTLAKKIVASHLGMILVESKSNHGTKVSIELPIDHFKNGY